MDKCDWQDKGAGHRQRLRDKLLAQGIEAFTDSEIIELLLTFGTPRSDCKEAARAALAQFKSLPAVLDASPIQLQQIKGIGPKNIFALQFIQGVARRYLRQRIVGKQYVHSSREVADYLIHSMRGLQHEVLTVVFLDAAHGIIDAAVVAEGTVTVNTVYPRELVKAALARNASALVIAHNHPSGSLTPSRQDEELTRSLHLICSFMHINLLDHLIIGASDQVYSFADQGIMAKIRADCRRLLDRTA
ncbi:DNA repair protein RadC [Desulfobulbus propionicus DSM 2032]|uniref:DNA repair protein RadC n=1 Tax=Desulfobulbus propionicus (strain ATCC 33891 / DSM 2032 / VKM B-1956 / 1pr3) TaxID=577650 RepID=A0A7U3YJK1_DESPD|nr:DNA repair protein RadC [Desulfobulbus propionicus]ADW16575.1 DNA repair protein RadC [Desulfobulbus propionicus DSM 2032]